MKSVEEQEEELNNYIKRIQALNEPNDILEEDREGL